MRLPKYNVGDTVLTSNNSNGYGCGTEICNRELVISWIDGTKNENPKYYFESEVGVVLCTRESEIVKLVRGRNEIVNNYPLY